MELKLLIFICFLICSSDPLLSQYIKTNKDSVNLNLSKEKLIDSLTNLIENYKFNYDFNELIDKNMRSQILDSLKSISALNLYTTLMERQLLDMQAFENIEKRNRIDLLLKTSQTHYNSIPKTDLGEVGKYLKLSKNIMAIILLIIHLSVY